MPVNCTPYYLRGEGRDAAWIRARVATQNRNRAGAQEHAERFAMGAATRGLPNNGTVLLVQNAFPCMDRGAQGGGGCHTWLQSQTRNGLTVYVRVDWDHSNYSGDHTLLGGMPPMVPMVPRLLRYSRGASQYFPRTHVVHNLPDIWALEQADPD